MRMHIYEKQSKSNSRSLTFQSASHLLLIIIVGVIIKAAVTCATLPPPRQFIRSMRLIRFTLTSAQHFIQTLSHFSVMIPGLKRSEELHSNRHQIP